MDVFDIQDTNYNDKIAEKKAKLDNRNTTYCTVKAKADAFILTGKIMKNRRVLTLNSSLPPWIGKKMGQWQRRKLVYGGEA